MAINLSTLLNASSNLQLAKAWVNFDGTTATPSTIRSSYNVSSVTKNGTGDYTVNFATPMADANYAVAGSIGTPSGTSAAWFSNGSQLSFIPNTTTSCRVYSFFNTSSTTDGSYISVQVFGN